MPMRSASSRDFQRSGDPLTPRRTTSATPMSPDLAGSNPAKVGGLARANPGKNLTVKIRVFASNTHIIVVSTAMVQGLLRFPHADH